MDKQSSRVQSPQPNRLTTSLDWTLWNIFAITTVRFCLTDKTTPFFYTPTSLLLKHSLITDVQQITGSNEQQWINCTRGGSWMDGRQVQIISVKNSALLSRNSMTVTFGAEGNLRNGLYYCSDGQEPRHYISLFLKNSSKGMICV